MYDFLPKYISEKYYVFIARKDSYVTSSLFYIFVQCHVEVELYNLVFKGVLNPPPSLRTLENIPAIE